MAKIVDFEDHCWKDVISEADMKLSFYERCARETFVGPSPALICIDLYNSAYRGGPLPPSEIQSEGPNSCGIYSHRAIEPTKKLIASARRAGIPIFFCTQDTRPHNRPPGAVSTRTKKISRIASRRLRHLPRVYPARRRRGDLQAARQRVSGHAHCLASVFAWRAQPHCLRREHVRLRARQRGRCLFHRLSCQRGRGMHL